jgi:[ribosomal protein S5]-alanine N-acetyltransferase
MPLVGQWVLIEISDGSAIGDLSEIARSFSMLPDTFETPRDVERTYVLAGRDDNLVRGAFALRQPAAHRLDCGYVLARRWWRQGLMTEILSAVAVWALRQRTIFRISAVCDVENAGSARVLEKSGFAREGVLRRWLVRPNIGTEPRDCYSYARVR